MIGAGRWRGPLREQTFSGSAGVPPAWAAGVPPATSPDLLNLLQSAYERLSQVPVAVRSSAIDEDGVFALIHLIVEQRVRAY